MLLHVAAIAAAAAAAAAVAVAVDVAVAVAAAAAVFVANIHILHLLIKPVAAVVALIVSLSTAAGNGEGDRSK